MNEPFDIEPATLDFVIAHAREALPNECCGVLLGRDHSIVEAVRITNRAADPSSHYLLDAPEHIAAQRAARARNLDVLGFYHSHPRSTATPSATDVAEATYPDLVYLIVGLETGEAESRLFRLGLEKDVVVREVPLAIAPKRRRSSH